MVKSEKKGKIDDYVYDISLDGTVVNAMNMMVMSNTDGMNMEMPSTFRYTEEHPYISTGLNRNTKPGEKYVGVKGDVAEFNDLFMRGKMGLGIDEFADATINFSRKNYADLLSGGEIKKVGNTIKSKKMPVYIENFLDKAINDLLYKRGQKFLNDYYDYVERIYNYQIPLKEIASKGKIKISLDEYKEKCNEITKSGSKKARQAWYELAIKNDLKVDIGSTVYYINTGEKKGDPDVKKTTQYFVGGEEQTKTIKKYFEKFKKSVSEVSKKPKVNINFYLWFIGKMQPTKYDINYEDRKKDYEEYIKDLNVLNCFEEAKKTYKEVFGDGEVTCSDFIEMQCELIPSELMENDESTIDNFEIEYNVDKYLDAFNKKIKTLLVCFHPNVRYKEVTDKKGNTVKVSNILIDNPSQRKFFTEEESQLVSGYPNKETDQDTYEQLMSMEKKEIDFWVKYGETPPFVDEIGMDWEKIKKDYEENKICENTELFKVLDRKYYEIIESLTIDDIDDFYETGEIPSKLQDLVFVKNGIDPYHFYFKEMPNMTPSYGGNIFEDLSYDEDPWADEENANDI